MRPTTPLLALALTGTLLLAACGDDDGSTATSGGGTSTTSVVAPDGTATTAGETAPDTGATEQVSANDATREELQAAFEAVGVPNAAKWAREVEEYRPYPEDDPSFAELRQELAKYNPAPEVVELIVATLTLP